MARRRYHRRWAGVLVVLVSLQAILLPAQASLGTPVLAMHPSRVPTDGTPFLVRVSVQGEPHQALELKTWVGSAHREASRTWNGSAWIRGDRYALRVTTDDDGSWRGWTRLRVNPDGAAYPDLLARGNRTGLWVRARQAGGDVLGTNHVAVGLLRPGDAEVREGLAPASRLGLRGRGGWAVLGAAAPDPAAGGALPIPGAYRVEVPRGAGRLVALAPDGSVVGAVSPPARPNLELTMALPRPPDGGGGLEAWSVGNAGTGPANLTGTCLHTPHGRACFLGGRLPAGDTVTVARNASAYRGATGDSAVDLASLFVEGAPSLPDGAGVLDLESWGRPLDVLAYGPGDAPEHGWTGPRVPPPFPGEVLRRRPGPGAWQDANASADWARPVAERVGQSRFRPTWMDVVGRTWTALAPDDDLALLDHLLRHANRSIEAEVYLLTSPTLGRDLVDAARRGVNVTVLVDGSPVGGEPREETAILENLAAAGGRALRLRSAPGYGRRYATLHAKTAVVDGRISVVGSENWVATGYPPGGGNGNRGWVVAVANRSLARTLDAVLAADRAPRPDVASVAAPPDPPPLPPVPVVRRRAPPPGRTVRSRVLPILAPDSSLDPDAVLGLLRGANRTLDVELLSLDARWSTGSSPLVSGLVAAARRGVRVRVLLDGTYVDPATGEPRNAPALQELRDVATRENLSLAARLVPRGTFSKVHVKGAVADGSRVLVGSLNWGQTSVTRDREVDLLIANPTVAAPYAAAFEADWQRAGDSGVPGSILSPVPDDLPVPASRTAGVLASLAAAALLGGLVKDRTTRRK